MRVLMILAGICVGYIFVRVWLFGLPPDWIVAITAMVVGIAGALLLFRAMQDVLSRRQR